MDRFLWCDGVLSGEEHLVAQQNGVKLYDGDDKTSFEHGKASLTSHRFLWRDSRDQKCVVSLALSFIVYTEEQSAGWTKSPKLVLHLSQAAGYRPPGPVQKSKHNCVKLSFKEGGSTEFKQNLASTLLKKQWEATSQPALPQPQVSGSKVFRSGIGGIQKDLEHRHKQTDKNISQAFEDLSKLMEKAKEMVNLSKTISAKIKEKQGDITEDETIKFKSYLLSMGIQDPVTRDTFGSGDRYYTQLARQLSSILEQPLKECGGVMTLSDVYCRVNRARGMELLSPEDLINACKLFEMMRLPVQYRVFESGVMVVELLSHNEEQVIKETSQKMDTQGSLTAEELSKAIGLSVVLSKERLLATERAGKACRDETTEGLRFYPNRFITS